MGDRRRVFEDWYQCVCGQQDVIDVAQNWQKYDVQKVCHWLEGFVEDAVRLVCAGVTPRQPEFSAKLSRIAQLSPAKTLFYKLDKLRDIRRFSETALNKQLVWEDWLLE